MAEYIEREALMKNFCGYDLTKCVKYGNENAEQQHDSYSTMMMYEIADEIEDAPASDVAPVRHGRWILGEVEPGYLTPGGNRPWICSECGQVVSWMLGRPQENFCPNCGAKMDGDCNG